MAVVCCLPTSAHRCVGGKSGCPSLVSYACLAGFAPTWPCKTAAAQTFCYVFVSNLLTVEVLRTWGPAGATA